MTSLVSRPDKWAVDQKSSEKEKEVGHQKEKYNVKGVCQNSNSSGSHYKKVRIIQRVNSSFTIARLCSIGPRSFSFRFVSPHIPFVVSAADQKRVTLRCLYKCRLVWLSVLCV